MVKNLTIGRYIETNSVIHRLDPRIKLIGLMIFITGLMMSAHWLHYLVLIVYTFFMLYLTQIPIPIFIKGIRPLLKIILFTASLQILFSPSHENLWQWGPFSISYAGISHAIVIFLRFSLIILITSVVGLSTKPLDLTTGVKKLLSPLSKIFKTLHDLPLMLSISLRFIPTLFDEGYRLKKAQEARGMDFNEGHFLIRLKKFLPLCIPIFVASFYRAGELAAALDVRGYVSGKKRTAFKKMSLTVGDFAFLLILVLFLLLQQIF